MFMVKEANVAYLQFCEVIRHKGTLIELLLLLYQHVANYWSIREGRWIPGHKDMSRTVAGDIRWDHLFRNLLQSLQRFTVSNHSQ